MKRWLRGCGLAVGMFVVAVASADLPVPPWGVVGEPAGTGSWPAIAEYRKELPGHTIYRPLQLPDRVLPVVLWGNGACRDNGLGYSAFLREIASHGYFVIALGRPRSERRGVAAPTERLEPDETSPEQVIEGLDWAVRENAAAGGSLYRRLDLARVAVMGHSCGGLQALAVSPDPRITTTVLFNSGVYVRGRGRSGVRIDKEILARLHGPIAYFTGGPDDMAHPNALDDLQRIDRVPAFLGALPVGHSGTFWSEAHGGEWAAVAVHWLDWQLGGSPAAASYFAGPACTLCTDPRWTVIRRRLD